MRTTRHNGMGRKIVAGALIFALLLLMMPISVAAETADTDPTVLMQAPHRYAAPAVDYGRLGEDKLSALHTYLVDKFSSSPEKIDISSFKIPDDEATRKQLYNYIWNDMPECFHVHALGCDTKDNCLKDLYVQYQYTNGEYKSMLNKCQAGIRELMQGLDDPKLTDVEKALLLHDRLIVMCEYDYDNYLKDTVPLESYTMYGTLVNRVAVCAGYAGVYMYIMRKLGIPCYSCVSDELNHTWNVVYIDGEWYHVDSTWDDPVWDATGRVDHAFFMVSSNKLYTSRKAADRERDATDFDMSPSSTKYDNAYWHNSMSEIQWVNDGIYYVDNTNKKLMERKNGQEKVLCTLGDRWYISATHYLPKNYACLSNDGTALLYSESHGIYRYDLAEATSTRIYKVEGYPIFGFTLSDNYLIGEQNDSSIYEKNTKSAHGFRQLYDSEIPTAKVTEITNDIADFQTVTVEIGDNIGVKGCYFGKDADVEQNSYSSLGTVTKNASVALKIYASGTYYFVSQDSSGTLSKPITLTFYKTTLDLGGGTDAPEAIITYKGNTLTFPAPKKVNDTLLFWAKDPEATAGITSMEPTEDATYYAIWDMTGGGTYQWDYPKDVRMDKNYTGFAKRHDLGEWWYVVNGKFDSTAEGAYKHPTGVWFIVKGGKIAWTFNGFYKVKDTWFYFEDGQVKWDLTGIFKHPSGQWFYVQNAMLKWDYTGFGKHRSSNTWFYCENGTIAWNKSGAFKHPSGAWFIVKAGQIDWSYTGFYKASGVWFYFYGGELRFDASGLYKHTDGNWYFAKNGQIQWNFSGYIKQGGVVFRVEKGKVKF